MLLQAQQGRRHYPTDDLAANVAEYKAAFGLPDSAILVGRVHRQFDTARNPTDLGEPIETALASAAELAAKACAFEGAAHEVSGFEPGSSGLQFEVNGLRHTEKDTAYFVRGSLSENPHA
jgi:hypothetical protein